MTYIKVPNITDDQRQIICGTVLGGSSIVKPKSGRNAYLSMRGTNPKWIQCKAQELELFLPQNPFLPQKDNSYYRWHSSCSPVFNEFKELFYEDGQKVAKMDVLNSLRNIGLAVWFLDCGRIVDNKIVMNLNFKDVKPILQYFTEIDLIFKMNKKIEFDEVSSKKFIQVIGNCIPSFMEELL